MVLTFDKAVSKFPLSEGNEFEGNKNVVVVNHRDEHRRYNQHIQTEMT